MFLVSTLLILKSP